jgi:hypothetical protein
MFRSSSQSTFITLDWLGLRAGINLSNDLKIEFTTIAGAFKTWLGKGARENQENIYGSDQGICKRGDKLQLFTDLVTVKQVHRKFFNP